MLGVKQLRPADVVERSDGRFTRPFTRYQPDGTPYEAQIPVCERCWEPIPNYEHAPSGYVSCDSARKLRQTMIDGRAAIEAPQKIVCYDCMREDYLDMHGGGFCESPHAIREG